MKNIKLSLLGIALLAAGAAFAGKAGDTFSYQNASGGSITQSQYLACPDNGSTLCGKKIDDQTHQVVETRRQLP